MRVRSPSTIRMLRLKIISFYFNHDGEEITVEAEEDSIVLVMSGEPINEPIASYGPFVMNTEAEIKQAFEEYKAGKFGYLED